MSLTLSRILLGIAIIGCIAIATCSSLLQMSHLAATGMSAEIANPETTIERRSQIAQGLDNGGSIQHTIANGIWWLALATMLLIAVVVVWGLSRKKSGSPLS